MSLQPIILDTDKTAPFYELPLKIRQGDTGDELQVTLGKSFQKYTDLSKVDVELIAKTPDQRLIKQPVTDKSENTFKVKFPDEMYTNVGVFRNMYFKIGDDSTSSVKLVVLQGIGSIKEAGSYIDDFETLIEEAQSYVLALKDFADTGNSTIDNKVAELTGKMTNFVDKSKEDLDAAKAAWKTFQENSETAATSQRDGFDTEFNKLISDDKAMFKDITTEFNTAVDTAKSQNTDNQTAFENAESKRENDFTSQSADFEKRYVAQGSDFEDRFKKLISTLQSDYDNFKKLLTNDVAGLNKKLTDLGTDTTALQTQADKISNQLDSVDLTQMTTNKNDIASLQTQVNNSAVGTNLLTGTYAFDSSNWSIFVGNGVGEFEKLPNYGSQIFSHIYNLKTINVKGSSLTVGPSSNQSISLVKGQSYTISVTARHNGSGNGNQHVNMYLFSDYTGMVLEGHGIGLTDSLADNFTRYSATFTAQATGSYGSWHILFITYPESIDNLNDSIFATLPKLEKGSVATDWCPNPTEIATNDGVQTSIKNALADYSTNAEVDNKISTGVGQAKTYAEQSIKDIIGAAPATLDTISELADAVTKNKDGVQAINDGITKKADKTEVTALQNTLNKLITPISAEDYKALEDAGTVDPKIMYVIPDA